MKRYILLFFCTLIMISSIILGSNYLKSTVVNVDTQSIHPKEVESIIVCSGKVEYLNSAEVLSENVAVIEGINVSIGDKVEKGTNLLNASEVKMNKSVNSGPSNYSSIPPNIDLNNTASLEEVYKNYLSSQSAKETLPVSQSFTKTGKKINVSSPIRGVITAINVKNQDSCDKGKPLISISDMDKYQIHLSVNESKIPDIKIGQKAYVTGVGFKDQEYEGIVSKISNEAQQLISATGKETVIDVFVNVEAKNNEIRSGLTAKCKIITSQEPQVNIVPYESVKADQDGKEYVYKYSNGRAIKTFITTGKEYNDGFEILHGLGEGDIIISKPEGISNFCRVRPIEKNEESL